MAERADGGATGAVVGGSPNKHAERLAPSAPLGPFGGEITLEEVTGLALVTVALPHPSADGDGEPLRDALEAAFGVALPAVGSSTIAPGGERLLRWQADRLYALFDADDASDPEQTLRTRLDARAYPSDQSDAWVMLRVGGARVRRALERVCPLDLHPEVFPVGAVARSVVEHLGAIVLRETDDAFLLLSPRSSARSFLEEIETSVRLVRERA